jgi:ABC-type bacteriocin/lantibiotic exporter with double-glycine peptidase domain
MRITDDDVRLVVADEPSAAMDPAGEYELFKNLREAQRGRTMIFITHRFGHLVKHADMILCVSSAFYAAILPYVSSQYANDSTGV